MPEPGDLGLGCQLVGNETELRDGSCTTTTSTAEAEQKYCSRRSPTASYWRDNQAIENDQILTRELTQLYDIRFMIDHLSPRVTRLRARQVCSLL